MNKITLLIAFACSCAVPSQTVAQYSAVSFGLKGGVAMTTVGGDDAELALGNFLPMPIPGFNPTAEPQSKTFFTGGAFVAYGFSELFSVQGEVLYSGRGVAYDENIAYSFLGNSIQGTMKSDAELTYLEIPVLARITLPVAGSIKPYLYAGPSFAFLLDHTATVTMGGSGFGVEIPEGTPVPATFNFNDFDLGASLGAGISVRMLGTAIGVEGRYTFGFDSMIKSVEMEGQESRELDMKNRAMSVTGFLEFYF